jgi:hypothetical protein
MYQENMVRLLRREAWGCGLQVAAFLAFFAAILTGLVQEFLSFSQWLRLVGFTLIWTLWLIGCMPFFVLARYTDPNGDVPGDSAKSGADARKVELLKVGGECLSDEQSQPSADVQQV